MPEHASVNHIQEAQGQLAQQGPAGLNRVHSTYEVDQPWVVYHYLTTDRRTRVTGRSKIECECAVCGKRRLVVLRIPRFGPVVDRGRHPERVRFLLDHLHRGEERHPMAWAKPLLNPVLHPSGIDLDLLAMRLEAELNEASRA